MDHIAHAMALRQRYPFTPYPRGWYVIEQSHLLSSGSVKSLHFFGQELVLYRTEEGQACLVGAFCPHLGAHLGKGGQVIGATLRCPFHHYQYDVTGTCVHAPYATRPPHAAQLQTWPILERDGFIFTYFDDQKRAPHFEIPTLFDDTWSAYEYQSVLLRTHVQELAENSVDATHAVFVHGASKPTRLVMCGERGSIWNVGWEHTFPFDYVMRQIGVIGQDNAQLSGLPETLTIQYDITFYGLGYIFLKFDLGIIPYIGAYRVCGTPMDETSILLHSITNVKPKEGADPALVPQVANFLKEWTLKEIAADFPIWENKIFRERPALCDADGPFVRLRKWTRQFYPEYDSA